MIKKIKGRFFLVCDVCGEPGPEFPGFPQAVEGRRTRYWKCCMFHRSDGFYDVCPECQKEQNELRAAGKGTLYDVL